MPLYSLQSNPFEDAIEVLDPVQQDFVLLKQYDDTSEDAQKTAIANLPFAPVEHEHAIDEITGLQTALDNYATVNHGHQISDVDGLTSVLYDKADMTTLTDTANSLQNQIDGKANAVHGHAIADVNNLQTALDSKASSTDVSSLQTQINGKAAVAHTHQISDVNNLQTSLDAKANSSDVASTVSVLQQTDTNLQGQIANKSEVGHTHLPADITGLSQSLSLQWTRRNANSDEIVLKTLVDTSNGDLILSVPANVTNNQEFEIKKIFASNYCRITGISKINGYSVNLNDLLFFDDALTQASTTKLIFIDSTTGWLSFPSSAFSKIQPLSLPTNKLKQLFYSGNISGIANGGTIQTWIDTISNLNASGGSATRPTLQTSIFGNNTIPGVLFNGSQWFQANLGWSNEGYITACVVERRNSGATGLCCIGIGTAGANGFEMSYGTSGTTFYGRSRNITTAFTVPAYDASNPLTRIWTFSVNSRENSLWMNGNKVIVSTSNKPINSDNTYIGANAGFRYSGWMPLLALYSGDITDTEIKAISDAANSTFKVY